MRRRDRDGNNNNDEVVGKGASRREKSVGAHKKIEDRSGWSTQYTPYAPRRTYRSKYQEFLAAEWRYQRNEVNITEETIVPHLPKNPLPEPDDADYHRKQLEFDDRINELFSELKDFQQEYRMKQREMKD